jgi:hypothetical protein
MERNSVPLLAAFCLSGAPLSYNFTAAHEYFFLKENDRYLGTIPFHA